MDAGLRFKSDLGIKVKRSRTRTGMAHKLGELFARVRRWVIP